MAIFATTVFALLVALLLYWGQEEGPANSPALWIAQCWLLIVSSRELSVWLSAAPSSDSASRYAESNPIDTVTYALLLLLGLLVLNRRARQLVELLRLNAPLLLYFFYCGLSVLWADDPALSLKRWIKGCGTLVMVLLVFTDPHPVLALRRLLQRAATVLLPASVLLILFLPALGTTYDPTAHLTYYVGVATQKNSLGVISMIGGLNALWHLLQLGQNFSTRRAGRQFFVDPLLLGCAYWLIRTSDSMTSFACLIIAGLMLGLLYTPLLKRGGGGVHLLILGAISLACFAAFLDSSGMLLRLLGRNASLTGRTDIWRAVLLLDPNALIGAGYESFWTGERIEQVWQIIGYTGVVEAHNGYLEIFINLGWIGISLLALLLASGYRNIVLRLSSHPDLGRLSAALLTSGLILNMSEAGFRMLSPTWFILLLATLQFPAQSSPGPASPAFRTFPAALPWTPRPDGKTQILG